MSMKIESNNGPFKFTVCAMCGKQYIRQPGSIYKVTYKGKINQCCSYKCYMKAQKLKEDIKIANKKKC